jgi:hypothetical protein
MRKKTLPIQIVIVLTVIATAGVLTASAATGPLVQVSDNSPFGPADACGNFPGTVGPPGTLYVNSEVEPWVDVNPANPNNIVASWQQDRWSNGGSRGNVAGVSTDGGASWKIVPVPGITDCTGGSWQRASDPWVSFSPDGTVHQISLVFDIDPPANRPGGFGRNGLAVSKSTDGGINWTDPILIAEDETPRFLNDKESITADPIDSDFVYAVWDRLKQSTGDVINPDLVPGNLAFKGPAMFARSTDGGDTWEPARVVYDPGAIAQTIGNQALVVLPDGTLVDFFDERLGARNDEGPGPTNLSLKYSTDKGQTWLPGGRPVRTNKIFSLGAVTPDDRKPVRDASILFDVAVDAKNGNLYAVWQDIRFGEGIEQIAFSMSLDGGFTWSAPVKINQAPDDIPLLRQQAFLPSVAVADNGTVGVTYYDFRNDDDTGELADHWFVSCAGGCSDAANWGGEMRLTDASFDYAQAPVANGLFLGDYVGLAAAGNDFLAFFQQSSAADPASGFFRRVTP